MSVGEYRGGEIKWRRNGSSDGHELRKASPRRNSGKGWIQKKSGGKEWVVPPNSTESGEHSYPVVTFEDISSDEESEAYSRGEVMATSGTSLENKLHPTTIISFPSENGRAVSTVLLDQCCTDEGLISSRVAKEIGAKTFTVKP